MKFLKALVFLLSLNLCLILPVFFLEVAFVFPVLIFCLIFDWILFKIPKRHILKNFQTKPLRVEASSSYAQFESLRKSYGSQMKLKSLGGLSFLSSFFL